MSFLSILNMSFLKAPRSINYLLIYTWFSSLVFGLFCVLFLKEGGASQECRMCLPLEQGSAICLGQIIHRLWHRHFMALYIDQSEWNKHTSCKAQSDIVQIWHSYCGFELQALTNIPHVPSLPEEEMQGCLYYAICKIYCPTSTQTDDHLSQEEERVVRATLCIKGEPNRTDDWFVDRITCHCVQVLKSHS